MNRFLFGLVALIVSLGSTAAHADWRRGEHGRRWGGGPLVEFEFRGGGWGHDRYDRYERYERRNEQGGRYELRSTNVWVPGGTQQIWVPGNCYQTAWGQQCDPGQYQTYVTQGHYETRQEYVWVPCWH